MFFCKKNDSKKEKKNAKELLRHAAKVYDYRCDVLSPIDLEALDSAISDLRAKYKSDDAQVIALSCTALDEILHRCGGTFYPVKFLPENIEMLLVAAILAIGIRTFFFQPFVIPTNSMYPTYQGMRPVAYAAGANSPNALENVWRFVTLGSWHQTVEAPNSGEVTIPIRSADGRVEINFVRGRKWLGILPAIKQQVTLLVNNRPVRFTVPMEFSEVEDLIRQAYFPSEKDYPSVLNYAQNNELIERRDGQLFLKTNKYSKKGKPVISFDILKGDMLFVNRWAYHFTRPKLGDPFVFATKNIRGLDHPDSSPEEKYFIKRLVGLPGDRLEVKPPVLYRNRAPIKSVPVFEANALKKGDYPGYTAQWRLSSGKEIIVLPYSFYAMGDNSPYSGDSRVWGFVPEKEVVGRAAFIFYPFTNRWGNTQ